jgi:hypothetical protein
VRVFSLVSFSLWLVVLFARLVVLFDRLVVLLFRLVVRFALVRGTVTSVGGTLVGGATRLNY